MNDPTRDATQPEPPRQLGAVGAAPPTMGTYRVVRLLGEGGMGAVYLAHDDTLDRPVAIKTMRPEVAARPGAVERFLREARAAAKVAHDHVVPILHVGQDAGTPFIAMPLLEGEPLDGLLKWEPRPPLGVTLKVGCEVAAGLAAAHAKGLIHRDIKPANIWIEGDPGAGRWEERFRRVKLLDFGLARPAAEDTQLTGQGVILGTPAFMSPEQARGEKVDHRTDLWSLGVVLYRMTAGRLPFRGANAMAVLVELATHAPPAPAALDPAVPPALSDLVMRLIAKECGQRPATAAAVEAELRAIGRQLTAGRTEAAVARTHPGADANPFADLDAGPTSDGTAPTELEVPPPPASRRGRGLWAAAGVTVLLAAATVAAVLFGVSRKKADPPAPVAAPVTTPALPSLKPAPRADLDRDVARWVLGRGVPVQVRTADGEQEVAALRELPTGPFVLTTIGSKWQGKRDWNGVKGLDDEVPTWKGLTGLTTLNLLHGELSEDSFRHIGTMSKLTELGLHASTLTDAGLGHLKGLTGLTELALNGTQVTDAGLAHLKGMTALKTLALDRLPVTDDGLTHLAGLTGLTRLYMVRTRATRSGVERLSQALPGCTIESDAGVFVGVGDRAVAEWVLSIGGKVWVRPVGAPPPGVQLGDRPSWWVDEGHPASADVVLLSKPADLPPWAFRVRSVAVDWLPPPNRVRGDDLKRFAGLGDLTHLNLFGADIGDADLEHLVGLPKLRWLSVQRTQVTDAGLKTIGRMTELRGLHLSDLPVTGIGLRHLSGLKELEALSLMATAVRGPDLVVLAAFPRLRQVNLKGVSALDDDGLKHLAALSQLEILYLHNCAATDVGLAHLSKAKKLKRLQLTDTKGVNDMGLAHLAELSDLTELNITGTSVTAAGVAAFRKAQPGCKVEWYPPKK
jgi:serine/threonine protein kinase